MNYGEVLTTGFHALLLVGAGRRDAAQRFYEDLLMEVRSSTGTAALLEQILESDISY